MGGGRPRARACHLPVAMSSIEAPQPGEVRHRHPGLRAAVLADARCTAAFRGERHEFRSPLDAALQVVRLAVVSDAFLGQISYRVKASLQQWRVPVLPRLFHRLAIAVAGIYIGDKVLVHPGIYIVHGQVVIDGAAEIHARVVISPAVTVGPSTGSARSKRDASNALQK